MDYTATTLRRRSTMDAQTLGTIAKLLAEALDLIRSLDDVSRENLPLGGKTRSKMTMTEREAMADHRELQGWGFRVQDVLTSVNGIRGVIEDEPLDGDEDAERDDQIGDEQLTPLPIVDPLRGEP